MVLVNAIKSNWIKDQNSLSDEGLREIAWLEFRKYHEWVQDRSLCFSVLLWLRGAVAVLRIMSYRSDPTACLSTNLHILAQSHPAILFTQILVSSIQHTGLDSGQRGWRETQQHGRSVEYHQFLQPWDFFGLATAWDAIQQAYGAADHNSCICNSLSIPKAKEKLVKSLC